MFELSPPFEKVLFGAANQLHASNTPPGSYLEARIRVSLECFRCKELSFWRGWQHLIATMFVRMNTEQLEIRRIVRYVQTKEFHPGSRPAGSTFLTGCVDTVPTVWVFVYLPSKEPTVPPKTGLCLWK